MRCDYPNHRDCRIPLEILVIIGVALDRYDEYIADWGAKDYEPGEPELIREEIQTAREWLEAQEAR